MLIGHREVYQGLYLLFGRDDSRYSNLTFILDGISFHPNH